MFWYWYLYFYLRSPSSSVPTGPTSSPTNATLQNDDFYQSDEALAAISVLIILPIAFILFLRYLGWCHFPFMDYVCGYCTCVFLDCCGIRLVILKFFSCLCYLIPSCCTIKYWYVNFYIQNIYSSITIYIYLPNGSHFRCPDFYEACCCCCEPTPLEDLKQKAETGKAKEKVGKGNKYNSIHISLFSIKTKIGFNRGNKENWREW